MAKSLREKVLAYAEKEYGTIPDQPWADSPDNDVLSAKAKAEAPGTDFLKKA